MKDLPPTIARACREITAFQNKLLQSLEKQNQYRTSIAQHIMAIKTERPNDWLRIIKAECGLRRSSIYNYLTLAYGTKTLQEHRAANAAANRRLRDRRRPSRDGRTSPPDLQHIAELEAAREHDLAEQLRLAEIRIIGLENENAGLRREIAALRQQLAAPPGPMPEFLIRPVEARRTS